VSTHIINKKTFFTFFVNVALVKSHDAQHNDIQHNNTQQKGLISDLQHNDTQQYPVMLNDVVLSVAFYLLSRSMSLC
jgi:hypothetical protein